MSMGSVICVGAVEAVNNAVEAWRKDHDEATDAWESQELIDLYKSVTQRIERWKERMWNGLLDGRIRDTEDVGRKVRYCLEKMLQAGGGIRDLIDDIEASGHSVDNASEFHLAADTIAKMHREWASRWPFIDEIEVEAARQRISRGEFLKGEDILREIHGAD